ncbi:hypothetical protein QJS10_CPB22g00669 [Acorus calamus]|uniref:Uncharacterized protein n=1 Tax=Acorus calamus TaxID=4465 RepID=A0AAV9C2G9_ACOCL|nr:hypothetical protein QJS10_CPB22g00669 [Acorus calamus]
MGMKTWLQNSLSFRPKDYNSIYTGEVAKRQPSCHLKYLKVFNKDVCSSKDKLVQFAEFITSLYHNKALLFLMEELVHHRDDVVQLPSDSVQSSHLFRYFCVIPHSVASRPLVHVRECMSAMVKEDGELRAMENLKPQVHRLQSVFVRYHVKLYVDQKLWRGMQGGS